MEITDRRIDAGRPFDWGRVSDDYARYRDVYPEIFYEKIVGRGLCVSGQNVLDLGTGTGVLPRNMYRYGARWTGIDRSPEQIEQAERLSLGAGMEIRYQAAAAEQLDHPPGSYDVVTACQCFWYFDHGKLMPVLSRILKENGRLLILSMAWLPHDDAIVGKSEALVLKYNPDWSGAGEERHPIHIPDVVYSYFEPEDHEEYDVMVPFSRQSWHGRMKTCRGIGASLSAEKLDAWEKEHRAMLASDAPERFDVLHYAALTVLRKKTEYRTGGPYETDPIP